MDRYMNLVRRGVKDIKIVPALPSRKYTTSDYLSIIVTYDQFNNFIMDNRVNSRLPKKVAIFDEAIPRTINEQMERLYILEKLNELTNVEEISLYLSDDSLRLYNELMKRMDWNHKIATTVYLTINRNPNKLATLRLDELQGRIGLRQDDLIWLPNNVIESLRGKVVEERDIDDSIRLKKVITNYVGSLDRKYSFERLTDFDKMYITYRFIKDNIRYATEAVRYSNELGHNVLNRSETRWESNPYGTFKHRAGVCEGQARLYRSLIANPYLDVNCQLIEGTVPSGEAHAWTGVITNDELYQVCLTAGGMFGNLDKKGYKPYEWDIYSKAYPHAYLNSEDETRIASHVRSLKK